MILSSATGVIYGLGVKIIKGAQARKEKIELEKVRMGEFTNEAAGRLTKSLDHLNDDFLRAEKRVKEIEGNWDRRVRSIEEQWEDFRVEMRKNLEEQRRMAEQLTRMFEGWAKTIQDTRDYITKDKT